MKKILHIIGGLDAGGAETMLMNIYRNIDRSRLQFDFLVYYGHKGVYDDEVINLGGKIIKITAPKKAGIIKTISEVRRVIKENGEYSAIHAHTLFNSGLALYAAKKEKINQRITHSHSTGYEKPKKFKWKLYEKIMRYLINRYTTHKIACGKEAGEYLFGKNTTGFYVINNFIDAKKFIYTKQNYQLLKDLNINQKYKICITAARFEEVKNHLFILEIAKIIKQNNQKTVFFFAGSGSLKQQLEQMVKEHELQNYIYFLGLRNDIHILLALSHFFLLPSLYEGFPLSLVEAQAAGVHCIISDKVTSSIDLGLNLTTFLPINNPNKWAETIINNKYEKPSEEIRYKTIKEKGFDIIEEINKIYKLYNCY